MVGAGNFRPSWRPPKTKYWSHHLQGACASISDSKICEVAPKSRLNMDSLVSRQGICPGIALIPCALFRHPKCEDRPLAKWDATPEIPGEEDRYPRSTVLWALPTGSERNSCRKIDTLRTISDYYIYIHGNNFHGRVIIDLLRIREAFSRSTLRSIHIKRLINKRY